MRVTPLFRDTFEGFLTSSVIGCYDEGREKWPKHKVVGQEISGTSGTQMLGCPDRSFMEGAFFSCFKQGMAGKSSDSDGSVACLNLHEIPCLRAS